jgi:hypothetical protein
MKKTFNIEGKISFNVDFDIEAVTEEEAVAKAIERLKDYYRLNVSGADHKLDSVKFDLDGYEYDEDEL